MSTIDELERRLRAARPRVEASPPPLTAVQTRIEREAAVTEPQAQRWWRRGRAVIPVALAAVVLGGAGGGALLLMPGKPLPPAFVLPANPETGLGQPVPASLALLPMRVADPGGGPPWGMRVIRTTRGLVCLQAGRVVGGQLGGLGSGYAFGADGRFHPFMPEDAIGVDGCPTVDGNGFALITGSPVLVTADGLPLAGENVWPGERVHCDLPGEEDWGVRCPQDDLRQVAMGLLGPDATSIQVRGMGQWLSVKPYGPEGAYLIVLPAQPNANVSMSSGASEAYGSVSNAPGGAVLTVTYNDGSECQIPASSGAQECQRKGIGTPNPQPPSSAQLSSPVAASYVPLVAGASSPLIAEGGAGQGVQPTSGRREGQPGPALAISFRAPVGAQSESSGYVVELEPEQASACASAALIVSQPTQQTITAGQRVQLTVPLEASCATVYAGRVFYAQSIPDREAGISHGGDEGPLYEVIAGGFGPRGGGRFPTVGRFRISVP